MERFAGLNVYGFNFIEVFTEIFSCGLGQKCLLFSIIKERHLAIFSKNFHCNPEDHEKCESLAQQIFLHLHLHFLSFLISHANTFKYQNVNFRDILHCFLKYFYANFAVPSS